MHILILYTPTYTEPASESSPEFSATPPPSRPFKALFLLSKNTKWLLAPKTPFPNLGRISSFQMGTQTAIFFPTFRLLWGWRCDLGFLGMFLIWGRNGGLWWARKEGEGGGGGGREVLGGRQGTPGYMSCGGGSGWECQNWNIKLLSSVGIAGDGYDTRFMRRRVCIQDWCVRLLFFWWRLDTREGGGSSHFGSLVWIGVWSLENLTRIDAYKRCSELGVRERGRR